MVERRESLVATKKKKLCTADLIIAAPATRKKKQNCY